MIKGHGDDIFSYDGIRHNFSSNIVIRTDLDALYEHLNRQMPRISSYPEPDAASLTRLWASSMHIQAENLCVTNGATEAIYLIAQVYRESVSTIFVPTFSEYADACRINRHTIREAYSVSNLNSQLSIFNFQLKDGLCWLCNPNNPTGKVFDHDWLTDLIESHPRCIFIIDQSYAPYTLKRVIDVEWAVQQPNVLLLHSMTKQFGVPGLRIGGVSGHPGLIHQLRLFLMPWSVNELAVEAGKFLLQNQWPQANVGCKMVNGKWSNGKWSMLSKLLAFNLDDVDYRLLGEMVGESVAVKERIVEADPLEHGIRKALNLGHTFGHAFESWALTRKPYLHGYAVAWGLICELYLSVIKTGFPTETMRQVVRFIKENYGVLAITCDDYPELYAFMTHDKKNEAGIINFTLLGEVGDIRINQTATKDEIYETLDFFREG